MNTENSINEATNPACFLGAVTRRFSCKKIRAGKKEIWQFYFAYIIRVSIRETAHAQIIVVPTDNAMIMISLNALKSK